MIYSVVRRHWGERYEWPKWMYVIGCITRTFHLNEIVPDWNKPNVSLHNGIRAPFSSSLRRSVPWLLAFVSCVDIWFFLSSSCLRAYLPLLCVCVFFSFCPSVCIYCFEKKNVLFIHVKCIFFFFFVWFRFFFWKKFCCCIYILSYVFT